MTTIGGVSVAVHARLLDVVQPSDSAYAEFVPGAPDVAPALSSLTVEVVAGAPPSSQGRVLFDSGSPWLMRSDGEGYRVEFRRTDAVHPHTVVCCDDSTSHVVIHLLEPGETGPAAGSAVPSPFRYPLDELVLMNHLATRSGVVVHSAGLVLDVGGDQIGLVLPGASGAGKTTLSEHLIAAGAGAGLLSDDRMILRVADDGSVSAWGTPWPGDAGIARNRCVPLRSLLFLVQADTDGVAGISPGEALRRLMPVISCPWYDRERFPAVLDTCGHIVGAVPSHELRFTRGVAVAEVIAGHAAALSSS